MEPYGTVGALRAKLAEFADDDVLVVESPEHGKMWIARISDRGPDDEGRRLAHLQVSPLSA